MVYRWESKGASPSADSLEKIMNHPRFSKYAAWLMGIDRQTQESPPPHYLTEKFDKLPRTKQRELLDYMDFLLAQQEKGKT